MTRGTPPSDWVAYAVVLSTVAAMMFGKYLIAKGDEPIQDVIKEDIEEIEHIVEDAIDDIEKKLK
jgi:hypothetical protein